MSRPETRLRTTKGTLVVDDEAVRLERGPLRRPLQQIPREKITHNRLTSRFHTLPLLLGGLLLSCAAGLTLLAGHPKAPTLAPVLLASLLLALVLTGLFCLLALPLALRVELLVATGDEEIRVRTGYHRRTRLEQIHRRLNEPLHLPQDLVTASTAGPRASRRPRASRSSG